MKHILLPILFCLCGPTFIGAQETDSISKINIFGDFRFRVEQDWNSELHNSRSRFRYRGRVGVKVRLNDVSGIGMRIRTGNINDQQGPHLTLGGDNGEFGLSKVGIEQFYYKYEKGRFSFLLGKSDINVYKNHEIFWNDNVMPEGITMTYKALDNSQLRNGFLHIFLGHYFIFSRGSLIEEDGYLQFIQTYLSLLDNRIKFFPTFYYFNNIGNIPDQKHDKLMDYKILHLAGEFKLERKYQTTLGFDIFHNFKAYNANELDHDFIDQRTGYVIHASARGKNLLKNFQLGFYYAYLEKLSIVDYFAQNDWARWDYSYAGASGSNLSNFKGYEIRLTYHISETQRLVTRFYDVDELVDETERSSNATRFRIDFDISF